MHPKIIFLGTGGDSFVVGKQVRCSGGIVVKLDSFQFHIDPGPGALVKAAEYGVNLRENTAVLLSNSSIINCGDANAVIDAMTIGGIDATGVLLAPSQAINGDDKNSPVLSKRHMNYVERVLSIRPGQRIGIEEIEIVILKAQNRAYDSVGFKMFTPNFVLSYSSDTEYSKEIAEQYQGSDILILNVPNPIMEVSENCLNIEDAIKIVQIARPRLVVLTHFGKKMLESDPLYEARNVHRHGGVQVIAAIDGMVINPLSYSANIRQRTLNLFTPAKKETVMFTDIPSEEVGKDDLPKPSDMKKDGPKKDSKEDVSEVEYPYDQPVEEGAESDKDNDRQSTLG